MRSARSRSAASCSSAHGEALYEGMIVGENAKPDDLEVNPMKAKQLTNFRASGGKDDAIRLTPPKQADAGTGDRLYRRRRDGRSDAEVDPPAQALPRPARAQAREPGEGGLRHSDRAIDERPGARASGLLVCAREALRLQGSANTRRLARVTSAVNDYRRKLSNHGFRPAGRVRRRPPSRSRGRS